MTISPSLLSANFLNLQEQIHALNPIENLWYHLDVMDGHFVPNLTFGPTVIKNLHKITKTPLDAHLMVTSPLECAGWFKNCQLHNCTIHFEACDNPLEDLKKLKDMFPNIGVSIKPKTPVSVLSEEILRLVDVILVMTVEPGFGGQSFMHDSAKKIQELNELRSNNNNYTYLIQVDGGVNEETAKICWHYGADNLVAGSYVFKNNLESFPQVIQSIRKG